MVLSPWPKSLREFTRFIWEMQTKRCVATNIQPIDLGCAFAENWLLPPTSTIATVIITQPISRYSFYRPTKGRRLSRPRHCSKGAQPVPKAVYRSDHHDIHNWLQCDSNLGSLTPLSGMLTTKPLRLAGGGDRRRYCQHSLSCWVSTFVELGSQHAVKTNMPWRKFLSPEYRMKYLRKLPLFL